MTITMTNVIVALCYLIFAPLVGGLLAGLDRKVSARMQGRRGPSIWQPFYDVRKLFNKQAIKINDVQDFLVICFLFFIIFTGLIFFVGGDLLLTFFALTLAGIFLVMAAGSANSPYSMMGAQREIMQMMTYEPMVLIPAVGFYMVTGSFYVSDIISSPISCIAFLPGIFFGFLYILTIKFRKSPFDLSTSHHAHQEMVKGISTEMSGNILGFYEIAHWYEKVFLLGVVGLFIVNSHWLSYVVAVVVCILTYLFETLIDNSFPRVKWQHMFGWTWAVTLIFGISNLLILFFIH